MAHFADLDSGLPSQLVLPKGILRSCSVQPFEELKREWTEQSAPDCWEKQVSRFSHQVALRANGSQATYLELDLAANRLAQTILAAGEQPQEPVTLLLEGHIPMVAAILGVLKAGKCFVPLDSSYPLERNRYILENSQAGLIVTDHDNLSLARSLVKESCQIINTSQLSSNIPDRSPGLCISPDILSYILYTSGSTGQPKGVVHTHRTLLHNVLRQSNGRRFSAEDRVALLHSYSFGASIGNIFGALLNGSILCPFDLKKEGVGKLARWLIEEEVTMIHLVPTVFRHFVATLSGSEEFPKLRLIRLGGETVYKKDIDLFKRYFGDYCILHLGMSTSETHTILQCFFDKEAECQSNVAPAGYATEDVEILMLDEHGQEAGFESIGEIAVKSRFLSPGYWRKPDLTKAVFLSDPEGRDERIYLTGDLGYRLPDGCVYHLGRKDHQVKIRGYRVEVGEIEAALLDMTGVREAAVIARDDLPGDNRLVAYIVRSGEPPPPIQALRNSLRERLPSYMVPSRFIALKSLPLLPNGKLDRKALPAPDPNRPDQKSSFIAPRTPVEEMVAGIWEEVLKVPEVGVEEDFFDLGGHSLLATQMISRLAKAFQIDLPLQLSFEFPTVAGLARQVETVLQHQPGPRLPPLRRMPRGEELPLSFGQERLWFLDQLDLGKSVYNVPWAMRLRGELVVEALERALERVVRRHEVLRTRYESVEGRPVQEIEEAGRVPLRQVDLRTWPEEERAAEVERLVREEARRAFDLSRDVMLHALLVREQEAQWVLALVTHHIASDAWSHGILSRELGQFYGALCQGQSAVLEELPIQYADYVLWQRQLLSGEILEQQLSYWKRQLRENLPALELPTDRPRPPVLSHRGGRVRFELTPQLSRQVKELSRQEGITLFMTLLAALQTLLYRYTRQTDLLVGTPIAGRTRPELEGLIGFFVNTLVLRTALSGEPSFRELLGRVREVALEAYAHQEAPFEKLVEELQPQRDLSRNPLFQVMFVLQNAQDRQLKLGDLEVTPVEVDNGTAKFDLLLLLTDEAGGLKGSWEYSSDLFDRETVRQMGRHFQKLLGGVIADPGERISRLPLLTDEEQQRILVEWNRTESMYPVQRSVVQLFEEQAGRAPEAIAVMWGGERLTYGELNQRANRLAHYLGGLGVGPEVRVGIHMERSLELVAGLLGILKAGGAYVPLDPAYPRELLGYMIRDAGIGVMLTQERLLESMPPSPARVVCLDRDWAGIEQHSGKNLVHDNQPDHLAYVIYTSGSTGKPKGVAMVQHALVNLVQWQRNHSACGPGTKTLQFAPLSFDVSFQEFFSSWYAGGTVVIIPEALRRDPGELWKFLGESQIHRLFLPPVALEQLACVAESIPSTLETLKEVITAGEALRITPEIRSFFEKVPACKLVNQYGPSETHVVTTYELTGPAGQWPELPPIGRPIGNVKVFILDDSHQPVPAGAAGTLYIGGPCLARGYLNHPELTAEKFIPNPFGHDPEARLYRSGDLARYRPDGNIEFLGRLDDQVKLRGFRIELGEIETVLGGHPEVRATVVTVQGAGDYRRLVAYVVGASKPGPTATELRNYLRSKLPDHMVPSTYMELERLPLRPSGKIDRKALPAPDQSRPELENIYTAPRTPVEELLAGIWCEVLKVERVGIRDDFFDLGGHSLLATQVVSRVRKKFQMEIPLRVIFEAPTVEGLAVAVVEALAEKLDPGEMADLVPLY